MKACGIFDACRLHVNGISAAGQESKSSQRRRPP